MKTARDLVLPVDRQELKSASRALVRAYGGQKEAADAIGRRQQWVSDAIHANTPTYLTIEHVAQFEDNTAGFPGHPLVTRELAKRQGFALVKVPDAEGAEGALLKLQATQARAHGESTMAVCEALFDGVVEPDEATHARRVLRHLIETTLAMDATLAAMGGKL